MPKSILLLAADKLNVVLISPNFAAVGLSCGRCVSKYNEKANFSLSALCNAIVISSKFVRAVSILGTNA